MPEHSQDSSITPSRSRSTQRASSFIGGVSITTTHPLNRPPASSSPASQPSRPHVRRVRCCMCLLLQEVQPNLPSIIRQKVAKPAACYPVNATGEEKVTLSPLTRMTRFQSTNYTNFTNNVTYSCHS